MSSIEEIKIRIDIVDLVSESVQLRRSGKNYIGFCPFHDNTRTPAFVVFPESGTWRCFGQCNEGGDIFQFVMKKEGWDFKEALQHLAQRAGVELKPRTAEDEQREEEHARLRALLEEAAGFYQHALLQSKDGAQALHYLQEKRNLSRETIERFGLGYAPDGWETTMRYLLGCGYSKEELLAAGMVTQRDDGRMYDRFRNRITIPIRDSRGHMAGFGARILNPDDFPKFLNSPQTLLFDKGSLLYGLHLARKAIRRAEQAVIVEGYLDVIAVHQAGFENVVSPMGTALTERHLYALKRLTRRIVLALDPDAAGDKATLRGLQVARQALEHSDDPVFDARGLLHHEARLQADIRVATLPDGLDPDEIVARDPQEWAALIQAARPVVVHVMQTLAQGRDLQDPKVKVEIANRVLPLIEDIPNPIERETYRQQLARLLQVDERALSGMRPPRKPRRRTRTQRQPAPTRQVVQAHSLVAQPDLQSAHVLGILVRNPDWCYHVDRALQAQALGRLCAADFQNAAHQAIFNLLLKSLQQVTVKPHKYLMEHTPEALHEILDELYRQGKKVDDLSLPKEQLLEDIVLTIIRMRRQDLVQRISQVRFLMEEIPAENTEQMRAYTSQVVAYNNLLKLLDRAREHYAGVALSEHLA